MDLQLKKCLLSVHFYKDTKKFRCKLIEGDQEVMNVVQSTLSSILRDKTSAPTTKFLAMRFAKDSIETFNDDYISQFQLTLLPIVEKLALYSNSQEGDERGKLFFSNVPDHQTAQLGKSFLRLCLENIWVWSKWFPIDPDTQTVSQYKISVEKLILQNVKFPEILYYDFQTVVNHIPDMQVPIKLLNQCREIIKSDLKRPVQSTTRQLQQMMSTQLQTQLRKSDKEIVFYAQIFDRVLQKIKNQSNGLKTGGIEQEKDSDRLVLFEDTQQNIDQIDDISPEVKSKLDLLKDQLEKAKQENQQLRLMVSQFQRETQPNIQQSRTQSIQVPNKNLQNLYQTLPFFDSNKPKNPTHRQTKPGMARLSDIQGRVRPAQLAMTNTVKVIKSRPLSQYQENKEIQRQAQNERTQQLLRNSINKGGTQSCINLFINNLIFLEEIKKLPTSVPTHLRINTFVLLKLNFIILVAKFTEKMNDGL